MLNEGERKRKRSSTDVLRQMEAFPVFCTGSSAFISPYTLAKGEREERKQLLLLKPVIGVPRLH